MAVLRECSEGGLHIRRDDVWPWFDQSEGHIQHIDRKHKAPDYYVLQNGVCLHSCLSRHHFLRYLSPPTPSPLQPPLPSNPLSPPTPSPRHHSLLSKRSPLQHPTLPHPLPSSTLPTHSLSSPTPSPLPHSLPTPTPSHLLSPTPSLLPPPVPIPTPPPPPPPKKKPPEQTFTNLSAASSTP